MRTTILGLVVALVCYPAISRSEAQDPMRDVQGLQQDPSGLWRWNEWTQGEPGEWTLRLHLEEDGLLRGHVREPDQKELEILNGTFDRGWVSFEVTRQFGSERFTAYYRGKVLGNSIRGQVITDEQVQEWSAKHVPIDR